MAAAVEELEAQLVDAMADMDAAAEKWTELRAAGKDTQKAHAEWDEAERATRRLERKIHKIKKKERK